MKIEIIQEPDGKYSLRLAKGKQYRYYSTGYYSEDSRYVSKKEAKDAFFKCLICNCAVNKLWVIFGYDHICSDYYNVRKIFDTIEEITIVKIEIEKMYEDYTVLQEKSIVSTKEL